MLSDVPSLRETRNDARNWSELVTMVTTFPIGERFGELRRGVSSARLGCACGHARGIIAVTLTGVAELAYAADLNSAGEILVGSSPTPGIVGPAVPTVSCRPATETRRRRHDGRDQQ